ncbi:hypothetical protein PhCBS80983_g01934 [Powellomyces hirtus]|uniref:Uncharacterized protein n=1 Tax=Powellomyces hirtus TaxID=109895 RepID=A0A507E8S4_9FUNG|nr:hypothetical protein PhCBS80983_g01934 [Powellomyces hirtus]
MGAADSKPTESTPIPAPSPPIAASSDAPKPKCKPCCACPDTRKARLHAGSRFQHIKKNRPIATAEAKAAKDEQDRL